MNQRTLSSLALILVALFVLSMAIFTVDQRRYAIVFQFSEAKQVITEPGLYFKIPLLQDVRYFDNRTQTIDSDKPALIQTNEKMNVKADSFIKYRIVDVAKYYKAYGFEGSRNSKAREQLNNTVNNMLRDQFGQFSLKEVVSGKRDEVMAEVRAKADAAARAFGIEVIDVRIKRVELVDSTLNSVYLRMQSERKSIANLTRASGSAEAERIKADADKQREIIVADAYSKAQQIKGEGDAKAAAIYAEAFGRNPEFYAFYKSLDAYKQSFAKKSDVLVVDPSADFFKYMKNSQAGKSKTK
ncbi:membrane protease subunit HflC [Formivibrio citricus]|uniref:Protein HflC n=1 Tax=Formivibrio citricus TaxID=83765 RepID=A0A1I4XAK0_9NEIS|nr:protease modulator HflC [Formivibrio citricus]SFN22937.1 membrane protease subunit HflC [Formivibrio citricus]